MLGDSGRLLDHLHAAGADADHADASFGQVDAHLRPRGGVGPRAGEVVDAGQVGDVRLGGEPGAEHEPPGADRGATFGLDRPLVVRLDPARRRDPGAETDVASEVPDPVDVVEVGAQFLPPGVPLAPVPVLPDRRVRVLVDRHVGVDPGAGVAVPVPDAAEVVARLEQHDVESQRAEPVQLVQPGEPGADDHDFTAFGFTGSGFTGSGFAGFGHRRRIVAMALTD